MTAEATRWHLRQYVSASSTASNKSRLVKLGTLCDTVAWNTDSDVLGAVSDGKLCFWYYPNVVFVDRDLIEETRTVQDAT